MVIALREVIAVVTGAAGGIGRAVVKAMADAGARVVATDLAENAEIPGADHYLRHSFDVDALLLSILREASRPQTETVAAPSDLA